MSTLRIATYNIHKGVQGLGPAKRLEIHNLVHAVEQFDADLVCLQEVRSHHRKLARHFPGWPEQGQADYLLPEGYEAVYRTNALTRHGEHGNALLSRWPVVSSGHEDVSDHRFEQRGLLHVVVQVEKLPVHVIVVHLGLLAASRDRQIERMGHYLAREVPLHERLVVAGDFNDWGDRLHQPMANLDLRTFEGIRLATFPSRLPVLHLDRIYTRGLQPLHAQVPRGRVWARMSDHLPLIAEFAL
ncbi:MAG: endonuclease/exonuclease/phosphatase family protein [Burkholderiales bacterium]|nr:endonuclease/exonuclease/phosphatase family protein [Burkholderiales bacterium]